MSSGEGLWKFFSRGFAAENKAPGAHGCEIILTDISNLNNGESNARAKVEGVDVIDRMGVKKSLNQRTSESVPATWKGDGGNRVSPPDIRRGEEVNVYTYADTGKYFWEPTGKNKGTRKLETVTYAFSGTADESDEDITEDNHYVMEVSTHNGHIVLSTSMANGEVCRWFLQIRGSDGEAVLTDEKGNEVSILSQENKVAIKTSAGAFVEVVEKTVNVNGATAINVISEGPCTVKANKAIVDSPDTEVTGNLKVGGNLEVAGGSTLTGHVRMPGGHSPPD